jgi:DNA polymerase-4
VKDDKVLHDTLREMSKEVAKQLRQSNLAGKTIKLKLRWPDFTTLTRQTTLRQLTDDEELIEKAALQLLRSVRQSHQAVRLIGVGVSGLGQPVRQLGFWDSDSEKEGNLQKSVEALQEKYGKHIIKKGNVS